MKLFWCLNLILRTYFTLFTLAIITGFPLFENNNFYLLCLHCSHDIIDWKVCTIVRIDQGKHLFYCFRKNYILLLSWKYCTRSSTVCSFFAFQTLSFADGISPWCSIWGAYFSWVLGVLGEVVLEIVLWPFGIFISTTLLCLKTACGIWCLSPLFN